MISFNAKMRQILRFVQAARRINPSFEADAYKILELLNPARSSDGESGAEASCRRDPPKICSSNTATIPSMASMSNLLPREDSGGSYGGGIYSAPEAPPTLASMLTDTAAGGEDASKVALPADASEREAMQVRMLHEMQQQLRQQGRCSTRSSRRSTSSSTCRR